MTIRAALYHRVSTTDQHPDAARAELRDAAARLGMHIVIDEEETGSGAKNNRPGLLRVMQAAQRGAVDAVLVWKLDRFGRSALDLLANIRALGDAGVRFVAVTQGLDIKPGGDAMSRLLVTMLAAIAEFERDLIRERTVMGMRAAKARGKHIGRPPSELPPRDAVAQLVADGVSLREMARQLGCSTRLVRRAKRGIADATACTVENVYPIDAATNRTPFVSPTSTSTGAGHGRREGTYDLRREGAQQRREAMP